METFAVRLRGLMEDRRVRVSEVAEACEVTPLAVKNWRKGSMPKSNHLASLAAFFCVSQDYLLNGERVGVRAEIVDEMISTIPHVTTADLLVALQVLKSFARKS